MSIRTPRRRGKSASASPSSPLQRTTRALAARRASKLFAALSALTLTFTLAACGNDASTSDDADASSSASISMEKLTGVSATGDLGKEPKVTFETPMTVENSTYAILQKGKGKTVSDGDRICMHSIVLNAKDGSELTNTWTGNTPDCSIVIDQDSLSEDYYNLFKGAKLNATFGFGINDNNEEGTSYIMIATIISKEKALTRAEGEEVEDIPDNLPKVTLADNGEPSLDLNGYKSDGKLVAQTLIKGSGKKVSATSTVDANYTGWLVNSEGKLEQFDSSWSRGSSSSFSLDGQVITGWTKGLTDQTVGSQVLLIIPPDEGYGSEDQKDSNDNVTIPANSTLYFVVDILYAS